MEKIINDQINLQYLRASEQFDILKDICKDVDGILKIIKEKMESNETWPEEDKKEELLFLMQLQKACYLFSWVLYPEIMEEESND